MRGTWPVTIPTLACSRLLVVALAPPRVHSNPVSQNQKRGRGHGQQVRFGGLNVLHDEDGNQYPVDDAGQLYVPLEFGQTVAEAAEEENKNEIKN